MNELQINFNAISPKRKMLTCYCTEITPSSLITYPSSTSNTLFMIVKTQNLTVPTSTLKDTNSQRYQQKRTSKQVALALMR